MILNRQEIAFLSSLSNSELLLLLQQYPPNDQQSILTQLANPPTDAPTADPLVQAGEKERDRLARKSRDALSAVSSIDALMQKFSGRCNQARRTKAANSLRYFLEAYFPNSTGMSPLSPDHHAIIDRIEVLIRKSGRGLNIMPRGFIKSTLSENSLLWALLFGYRKYALFFAGTGELAEKGVGSIRQELITNDLLLEDFPEACVPFKALEGKPQRCSSQNYQGQLTGIQSNTDAVRLAVIPGTPCSGGIVEAYGVLAPPRGARYKDTEGRNVRPDIAVLDDFQTDESAHSIPQTISRLKYIRKSIGMMGGHGKKLAMIGNATIIEDHDAADQLSQDASWMTIRVEMLKSMPAAMDTLWLGPYAEIRRNYDKSDPQGQLKAKLASTEFYKSQRFEMDAGGRAAWSNIGLEEDEISAIQHAMNIYIDEGPETFWAECQNKPVKASTVSSLEITPEVARNTNGYPHRVLPATVAHLVFGVDVHDELLYYTVAGVQNDFTGFIVDYGTWPEQNVTYFTKASAKQTLTNHYGNQADNDGATDNERLIELGLEDLLHKLLNGDWRTANGDSISVSCGLVDVGYKQTHVKNAIRRLLPQSRVVLCSQGIGIGPTKKPFAEYDVSPAKSIRSGPDPRRPRWILPTDHRDGEIYRVNFDTNFWKDTTAIRLIQKSPIGRWTFWGDTRADHAHFVTHCLSEQVNQVSANGRTVNVWENVRGDNHWWDTLVLCVMGASLCGAHLPVERSVSPGQHHSDVSLRFQDRNWSPTEGMTFFATARDEF